VPWWARRPPLPTPIRLSEAALNDCATTVRTIAAAGQSKRVKVLPRHAQGLQLYGGEDPIASLDSSAKVALLERIERMARAKDPAVVQVMAGLAAEHETVLIARADGLLAADVRPLVRLSLTVIAERDGRREIGSGGGGGRFGLAYFTDERWRITSNRRSRRGAHQPGEPPGARRRDDRGARPRLARRAAA
jgi:TldD protein